ncbi:MAG TPA: hypothetical protein VJS92_12770, partial [Candidatus Polarisedimenticolaceae bacterium]|nr:hypothetical protein [Candidatus Polarisedimenticolaceae bacterium]
RLAARLRLPAGTRRDALGRAARERLSFADPGLVATLRECEEVERSLDIDDARALRLVRELQGYARRLGLEPAPRQEER